MINGLVVTHGDVGRELVRVVEMILGPVDGLDALSNGGKSMQDLTTEIGGWLDAGDGDGRSALLFVDDFGGSCASAAQLALVDRGGSPVLTGVNLAMLLDFATWRDTMSIAELSRRLVEKGREAISVLHVPQEG